MFKNTTRMGAKLRKVFGPCMVKRSIQRTRMIVDLESERASRERERAAKKITLLAGKISRMVKSRKRCGLDVLKVFEMIERHDNFMQELAVMKIDYEKHLKPHQRVVGF